MKNRISFMTAALLISFVTSAYAQSGTAVSELYLKGKWKAECAIEVLDKATIRLCPLCDFETYPDSKSKSKIKDLEMNFDEGSVTIIQNGERTTVRCERNPDNHSIRFSFRNTDFQFSVFFSDGKRILTDQDGLPVILTKAD